MLTRRATMLSLAALAAERAHAAAAAQPWPMREVAPGIHVRQGVCEDASAGNGDAIANIGFVIGKTSVAVIDPGGSRADGERLRASILATTGLPIRTVIMSHMHPDHVFGCVAFEDDDPAYVAHSNMLGPLVSRGEYYRRTLADILGLDEAGDYAKPTVPVEGVAEIDLGGRVLQVRAHGAAHTDNDLSVFDVQTGTLWAADLLFVDRVPSLDGSLLGWQRELAVLAALPARLAVPGHGPPGVAWPAGAADILRYLSTLTRDIRGVISRGGDIQTAVDTAGASERGQWCLFDDYNGRNVTAAFKELEWE